MFKRLLLLLPALAGAALLATRLVPGPLRDGTTQLASGWRIRPAGRQVTVGTLPLNLLALSDGSVLVTNNGYGENGLMRIDPVSARVVWRTRLPAAWLGLARAGGGWGDSTVSVIDLTAYPPIRLSAWFVGPHPSALALRGSELFVALAGSNGVARVDLATGQVHEQLTVALAPHAPVGSDPNALALSPDGRTLYVAMAGNNAVAAVRLSPATMQVAGLIPVGWYPTAVAVAADGKTLFVANGKGAGSHANPDGSYIANRITGRVPSLPAPDRATLARYTREVYALSPYSNARIRPTVRASDRPTEVKHVVYIIRENRTYDQVFGDVSEGNGDPSLAIFNDSITPNAHAIARRWVLFDNFYVDGVVSADGHEWSDRAFANDYNEKTWPSAETTPST